MWNTLKQISIIMFVGFSFFSTSFIISLLIGTAALHPILGTIDELVRAVMIIIVTSIIMHATMRLYDAQPKRREIPRLPRSITIR